jgi:MerR family transcriptional regulator, mercuric resistance operon regulatory protein
MTSQAITNAREMTIGALSRRTGVNIETIRYYEKIALLPPPPRTAGGRRIYGPLAGRRLGFIRCARELGFSMNEIRALLDLGEEAKCLDVCEVTARHLTSIRAKIADLQELERSLSRAMAQCAGKDVAACAVLDALYPAA